MEAQQHTREGDEQRLASLAQNKWEVRRQIAAARVTAQGAKVGAGWWENGAQSVN